MVVDPPPPREPRPRVRVVIPVPQRAAEDRGREVVEAPRRIELAVDLDQHICDDYVVEDLGQRVPVRP